MSPGSSVLLAGQDVFSEGCSFDFRGDLGSWVRVLAFLATPPSSFHLALVLLLAVVMADRTEDDTTMLTEEIKDFLKRLKFSEDESGQVISTNGDKNMQGFESWVVGKIMVTEIPNREAMMSPFWIRVYNFPLEFMDRQMAIDVGNALGELVAIDWKDHFGGWTEFMRIKVKIDILKPLKRVLRIVNKDGGERIGVLKYERLPDFCYLCGLIGHTLKRCNNNKRENEESLTNLREKGEQNDAKGEEKAYEEESMSTSPLERRPIRPMEGCLAVSSEGKSGGLALLWRKGMNTNPSLRQQAWDMLRRVQSMVNEAWIVGGDFKAILNNSEKEGGRRNPKIQLDEFSNFLEELNLTDVMTCNGWFTWTNNRDGTRLVKERVDRFAISKVAMEMMPFLLANIVRQSKSDQEAIPLDTNGSKPKDKGVDHRVWFRYDTCWGKEEEAKNIINSIWSAVGCNTLDKMERI
ncbi:hypothetical protein GOBAR_AA34985 [Gossypium barbadense]|uniref:Zinc knuckle CX2CX4HX4C domain-containing protein n=1 Tax=Gossypium barbadense TaxID=3634 RepID=A0A2P5W3R4_GOSBA|nr:hypothetical protein GOBAR_AA34985 [Gossypium barbadense]